MGARHLPAPAVPARTGVWIGIGTISMSFAAYTSAMVVRAGAAPDWVYFHLPPILYLDTALLLLSSATLELGRQRLATSRDREDAEVIPLRPPTSNGLTWLQITLALGLLFVAGQLVAWRALAAAGFYLATNPSSAFFYIFTALHGLHLLGGIVALLYVLRRLHRGITSAAQGALGAVSLYWHFMGVLWLYLLVILSVRL
jgi:cytochrome c oxidase subunit 3